MERAMINGTELEVEVRGAGIGETVMLVHGSILANAFAPLLAEPSLTEGYRVISYHRRGYAGSARHAGPFSISQHAADCLAVMRHAGVADAHVVGHSYGGTIALQLALDAPAAVKSLTLLEPAMVAVPSGEQLVRTVIEPALQQYRTGNKAGAIETFLRGVCGPEFVVALDRLLPGDAFALAVADADAFFQIELPALADWSFTAGQAARIRQPALAVLGADSEAVDPCVREGHELLKTWLPRAESFVLPNATHGLQVMNPHGMAEALTGFLARQPAAVAAAA